VIESQFLNIKPKPTTLRVDRRYRV